MTRTTAALAIGFALSGAVGCTVGEGSGSVTSDRLYLNGCWNGPFDLKPDFFAANPYQAQQEQLIIRVQRGDNNEEQSDGLVVVVRDVAAAHKLLGAAIPIGLPPAVVPPGQPPKGGATPLVSLSLYLHATCHEQNSATYAVGGSITFKSLFSGDPNEEDSDARLTDATFDVQVADPRDLVDATDPAAVTSEVNGNFRFFFQRGQPAQPFQ